MMQSHPQSDLALPLERQNALAHAIQSNVPFVSRPFAAIGEALGVSEEAVLGQLSRWQSEGKLREVSAILEGSALGYDSALVAGRVPVDRLDEVAAIVNAHPTVTHNYLRNHDYNLWFTIAVPHEMGLERTLALLAAQAGVPEFFPLRRTHTFKVGVNFDLVSKTSTTAVVALEAPVAFSPSERDALLFRALQTPLPLTLRPFASLAARAGVSEATLLDFARGHLGNAMRRYVGTFHHRRLGVRGNGMVVWRAPNEELPRLGPLLAQAPEVSHCYARNSIPGFDFTLYSMLHGPSDEACRDIAGGLAARLGIADYLILFSSHEYKKCRLRYFLPELDAWWAQSTVARAS